MLCDNDIKKLLEEKEIIIEPLIGSDLVLQPASIDVRLSNIFLEFKEGVAPVLDPYEGSKEEAERAMRNQMHRVEVEDGKPYILYPGSFVLASTLEFIGVGMRQGNIAARLEGRSSFSRLGVAVHSTGGFIDPGFYGQLTFELYGNLKVPVALWPGTRIGQLAFFRLSGTPSTKYSQKEDSKYQGSGPVMSHAFEDEDRERVKNWRIFSKKEAYQSGG